MTSYKHMALASCASYHLLETRLFAFGAPTIHNVRVGSPTVFTPFRKTGNSPTRMPSPVMPSSERLTFERRRVERSSSSGMSSLVLQRGDADGAIFDDKRALEWERDDRGYLIALHGLETRTTESDRV